MKLKKEDILRFIADQRVAGRIIEKEQQESLSQMSEEERLKILIH